MHYSAFQNKNQSKWSQQKESNQPAAEGGAAGGFRVEQHFSAVQNENQSKWSPAGDSRTNRMKK
jgi:hypothetical protein